MIQRFAFLVATVTALSRKPVYAAVVTKDLCVTSVYQNPVAKTVTVLTPTNAAATRAGAATFVTLTSPRPWPWHLFAKKILAFAKMGVNVWILGLITTDVNVLPVLPVAIAKCQLRKPKLQPLKPPKPVISFFLVLESASGQFLAFVFWLV